MLIIPSVPAVTNYSSLIHSIALISASFLWNLFSSPTPSPATSRLSFKNQHFIARYSLPIEQAIFPSPLLIEIISISS